MYPPPASADPAPRASLASLAPYWLAAMGLGVVFLVAAATKGADPKAFVEQVASYGIVQGTAAAAVAYALVPLEALLGASLLLGFKRRIAAVAAGLLLLFFIGVTAWGWSHGKTEGCGCFGSLSS